MVQDTSIKTYQEIMNEGLIGSMQKEVALVIFDNTNITDKEISEVLNYPINTITGRRNELVKMGMVESNGKREQSNGRTAYQWRILKTIYFKPLKPLVGIITCPMCKGTGKVTSGQTTL